MSLRDNLPLYIYELHEGDEDADFYLIVKGMEGAIAAKTVTYDFARLMDNPTDVKCSEFGDAIIKHM